MVLRELAVRLGLQVDHSSFKGGTLALATMTGVMNKAVEIGTEFIASMGEQFMAAVEYGDKINKLSQSIGVATDALQELQYAGSLADVSAETMAQSIGILSRKMLEAKGGGEAAAKAFKGISFQSGGKLKATDEVLGAIADKFASMPDGAEKTALAMELFGRAGKQMIPLLNKGSGELEEMREEARKLGLVMDGDALEASEELNDNLHRMHAITQGLWRTVANGLIPTISRAVKAFLEWRKANAEIMRARLESVVKVLIAALHGFVEVVQLVYGYVKTVGGALAELAKNFWELGTAAKTVAVVIAAALALAFAPLVVAGVALAGFLLFLNSIKRYHEGRDSLFGDFAGEFEKWLKPNAEDPWWLTAVKAVVKLMMDAINLAHELDQAMGRTRPKDIDRRAGNNAGQQQSATDAITTETARKRAGLGLRLTEAEKEALGRSGVGEDAFLAKYSPSVSGGSSAPELRGSSAPAGSSSSATVQAPVTINVSGAGDPASVAQSVSEVFQAHYQEALASVPQ